MKVLIPVDSSIYSRAALDSVLACPWPLQTEFTILSVSESGHPRTDYWNPHSRELLLEAERKVLESHERLAASFAAELKQRFPQAQVESKVVEGFVVDKILEVAEHWRADLIVLGSHGLKGLTRFLIGSVSEAVASHAHCSVRIVRCPEGK